MHRSVKPLRPRVFTWQGWLRTPRCGSQGQRRGPTMRSEVRLSESQSYKNKSVKSSSVPVKKIFHSPNLKVHELRPEVQHLTPNCIRPPAVWILLIALFTGCRFGNWLLSNVLNTTTSSPFAGSPNLTTAVHSTRKGDWGPLDIDQPPRSLAEPL